ncbi:MAG: hypothetical protein ACFN3C_05960, partial [Stomatobaculum longum]
MPSLHRHRRSTGKRIHPEMKCLRISISDFQNEGRAGCEAQLAPLFFLGMVLIDGPGRLLYNQCNSLSREVWI